LGIVESEEEAIKTVERLNKRDKDFFDSFRYKLSHLDLACIQYEKLLEFQKNSPFAYRCDPERVTLLSLEWMIKKFGNNEDFKNAVGQELPNYNPPIAYEEYKTYFKERIVSF
jgi:hypothetical protein